MQHRDRIILTKIIQEIVEAEHILQNADFEAFYHSEIMKRAICMTVINIGELVKCLSDECRTNHKNIPWKLIAGFRDIAAHKYKTLDMKIVYNTVKFDIVEL